MCALTMNQNASELLRREKKNASVHIKKKPPQCERAFF